MAVLWYLCVVKRSGWRLLRVSHTARERCYEIQRVEFEVELGVGSRGIYRI